jgi:hypothetical protein
MALRQSVCVDYERVTFPMQALVRILKTTLAKRAEWAD